MKLIAATMRRRRRRLVLATLFWPFVCFGVLYPVAGGLGAIPLASALSAIITVLLATSVMYLPERRRGAIEITDDEARIDGRTVLARKHITGGYASTRPDGTHVARVTQGRLGIDVDFEVATAEEAVELLRALGIDRSRRTTRMIASWGRPIDVYKWAGGLFIATIPAVIATAKFGMLGLPTVFMVFVATMILAIRSTATIVVGSDGVLVKRWLARRRFIPFSEIATVRAELGQLEIKLNDGSEVCVHLGNGAGKGKSALASTDEAFFRINGLAREIMDAKVRTEEGSGAGDFENARSSSSTSSAQQSTTLLKRGGRAVNEWLTSLGGVNEDTAGFRGNAIPTELLWKIVQDPSAPATARAGAAAMLRSRSGGDEESREGLRIAAEACASPNLRVALSAAAEAPDDNALQAAFESLEDESESSLSSLSSLAAAEHLRARRLPRKTASFGESTSALQARD